MGSAEEEVPEISLSPLFCSFVEAPDKPVSTGGGHAPWEGWGKPASLSLPISITSASCVFVDRAPEIEGY